MDLTNYTVQELLHEIKTRYAPTKITSPSECLPLLIPLLKSKVEQVYAILLSGANTVIEISEISSGILNKCLVHPREVFQKAIKTNAAAIILAHNHPSGDPTISHEDQLITDRIKESGKIIGIELLDHIIIAENGYTSFLEERKL